MIKDGRNTIEVKDAFIRFKNFSGIEKKAMVNGRMTIVNDKGNRNFTLVLDPTRSQIWANNDLVKDPDFGQELANNKFNVTFKPGSDEGDGEYRLQVHIGFGQVEPRIYLVKPNNKLELLTEETLGILDNADIVRADLVLNNGKVYLNRNNEEKVKVWCNEAYFTVHQSRFASDYDIADEVEE